MTTTETEAKTGRGRLKGATAPGWTVDDGGFSSPPPPAEPEKKARKPRAKAATATKRPVKAVKTVKAPRATKKAPKVKKAAKRVPRAKTEARPKVEIPAGLPMVGKVIEKPLSPKALNPVVNAIESATKGTNGWVPVTHDGRDPKSLQSSLTTTARKMGVKINTSVVEIDGVKTLIAQAG